MFKAISSGCKEDLIQRANIFLDSSNKDAALLCLDRQFEHTLDFTNMDISEMASVLQLFLRYAEMLQDLVFSVDPCTNPRIWTLFGYRPHELEPSAFCIPPGTLLYAQATGVAHDSMSEEGLILSRQDLLVVFQQCLRYRLLNRVDVENDNCRVAPALTPCLEHVVYNGNCDGSLCNGHHIVPDKEWFSSWTRVHFLQILIYQTIIHLQVKSGRVKAQQR
jgi:hypothetical protein